MKPVSVAFITLVLALSSGCRSLPGLLTQVSCDWNFIQSVGGIKVNQVHDELQVLCDVSGLQTITVKPTTINSALGIRKIKTSREENIIRLTVVTSVIEKGMKTTNTVDLSDYPAGAYKVVYLDPDGETTHPLATIQVP